MSSKISNKIPAVPAVTGTVIPRDAVVFARPSKAADRAALGADNVSAIRRMVSESERIMSGLLGHLVLALVLNPTTSTDDKGRTVDALTALTSGDGAVNVPRSEVSKARAAFLLVNAYGISSTADERWTTVQQITGRAGVGADRVRAALKAKAKTGRALTAIGAASGDDKARAIRDAFPAKARNTDGDDKAASAAWKAADKALTAIRALLNDTDTTWNAGERKALTDALKAASTL